jgi:hypothetical protein
MNQFKKPTGKKQPRKQLTTPKRLDRAGDRRGDFDTGRHNIPD